MPYCANCGNEISAQAVMCPKCGHPGPAHTTTALGFGGPVAQAPYASYGARVGGYLIDLLIVGAILAVFFFAAIRGRTVTFLVAFPIFTLVSIIYKPLMEGSRGQTLGKMAVGIKVVRASDAGPIGYGEAFMRWLIGAVIGLVPLGTLVDLLWPLWDQYKQTLHDKVAKTIVIKL